MYRFVILGAGLAGLSLARALVRHGIDDRVAILDAKPRLADDRMWSFWDVDGSSDAHLASGRWERWELRDRSGAYVQESARFPYVALRSTSFYASVLGELAVRNVDVVLGDAVIAVDEGRDSCVVRTRGGKSATARVVFDARGLDGAMVRDAAVVQRFVGRRIETERDAFDPAVATLMAVQPDTQDGFHFFYILPFGPREALVENTYFARRPIARARIEGELDGYVAQHYGFARPVPSYVEAGAIPMSTALALPRATARVIPIGLRGGCARPGSGYTFHRTQHQVEAIADAIVRDGDAFARRRFALGAPACDAWLLQAARRAPQVLPGAFRRLFGTTEGDALARFMMDRANPAQTFPLLLASALGAADGLLERQPRVAEGQRRLAHR